MGPYAISKPVRLYTSANELPVATSMVWLLFLQRTCIVCFIVAYRGLI